jgi:Tol biopolymer transport system component
MSLDSRLRDELSRLAPADPSRALERVVEKRVRRQIRRKVQAIALALVVLAGTAGGFYGLTRVFGGADGARPGTPQVSNGRFAYVALEGSGSAIYSVNPDGSDPVRLVELPGTGMIGALDWSPDGSELAFVGPSDGSHATIFAVGPDGAGLRVVGPLTPNGSTAGLSWSPDGSQIAYVDGWRGTNALYVVDATGGEPRRITGEDLYVAGPDWSPDGRSIVFASEEPNAQPELWDIFVIDLQTLEVRRLTDDPSLDLEPAWSPDGRRIVFRSRRDLVPSESVEGADEIYVMNANGTGQTRLTFDESIDQSPVWSPDGAKLAYTSDCCVDESALVVMDPDGTNADRVPIQALEIAWQPIPAEPIEPIPTQTASPEPSPSPDLPEGVIDIGLGFPVCFSEELGGIDLLGDGTEGTAWTAVPVGNNGRCPESPGMEDYLLAVDHSGDRIVDAWIDLPFECWSGCAPSDGVDLDANGTEELVVSRFFSIMDSFFFTVRPGPDGELVLEPILVAEPGHEPADIVAGEPLRIDAWGDAGYGSAIECEGYPEDPVIVWSWSYAPVESNDPREVHITRLELQEDGLFHVVGTNDFTVPAGEPTGIPFQGDLGRECGLGWGR